MERTDDATQLDDLRPNEGANKNESGSVAATVAATARRPAAAPRARSRAPAPGVRRGFEGGQLPIQKRMPYKRGFTNIFQTRVGSRESRRSGGARARRADHAGGALRSAA